jgi:hypothetical protein
VIAQRRNEDLRLMFEPTEGITVDNTIPVALEAGTYRAMFFRSHPSP